MSTIRNPYLYTIFFVLYEVSTYLSNDMIMPGMVRVLNEFHAPAHYAATSLTYFILGGCFLPIILNLAIHKLGSRKVLIFGNGLFLFATLIIAFTTDIHQFLLARFFQGMGLGFIFIGYATVHKLFDDTAAIRIISVLGNISIMAPLAGPIIGAAIISSYNWRFVFILVGILGIISFYGLYKYMPDIRYEKQPKSTSLSSYINIIKEPIFLCGSLIISLNGIVTISWIGISPVIIFSTYKLSYLHYIFYQILVFSGSIVSSLIMQLISLKNTISLIKFGSILALAGLISSFVFSLESKLFCVLGLFIFTLGSGLYIGLINRIIIANFGNMPTSSVTALTTTAATITSCLGLELANYVCLRSSYAFPVLALFNLMIGISCFSLIRHFIIKLKQLNFEFTNCSKE